ncbi:hypothetical protein NBH00_13910 [Paraconexibacter antarcticus]|uniref:DUF559 domain-containing protein n=1 Tax=Paraconexibacter antarcticus TaxID=2949664 RepID=A0ABY5DNR7_9ACTN|nr:hypothetical protein [Paraconexibacter antarcticus]UTI62457.1 hypothetical protein NBH00_13910 [Paraconexibacter antarcticus]
MHVRQLSDCGLTRHAIDVATDRRLLRVVHRGVRAVGPAALSPRGRHWAAHLAVGRESAFTDLSGAGLLGIRPWNGEIHLAAPTHRRGHDGVTVHHVAVTPSMICRRHGLPVLRAEHVLLDLAARLAPDPLAIALNEALSLRLTTVERVAGAIDLRSGHRGRGALSAAVDAAVDDPGSGRTHGEFEALVLPLLRALPLPPYRRNELVELADGRLAKADLFFAELGVLVELDSRTWHQQRLAMDSDRRRDQQALAVGLVTFRVTWRHATREWDRVSADLLALLRARGHARTAGMSGPS